MFRKGQTYDPLFLERTPRCCGTPGTPCWSFGVFCILLTTFVGGFVSGFGWVRSNDRNAAWRLLNADSPIVDTINVPAGTKEVNGHSQEIGIYCRPPSAEVDNAWNLLLQNNYARVSSKDLVSVGKSPAVAVKLPLDQGYGNDAYIVLTDIGHKMHCLNRLRKEFHFDYYWKDTYPDGNATKLHQSHISHCIEILLQSVMCEASTDFMSMSWYENKIGPDMDYRLNRKCGDFDGVLHWAQKNSISSTIVSRLEKPNGQKALPPMPQELIEILRQTD